MRVPAGLPLFLLVSFLAAAPLASAAPPAPAPSHPILGIWKLSLPALGCSETYRFRGDGTTLVTSAEEVSESEFRIPDQPSEKGFYKLEDRIVKAAFKELTTSTTPAGLPMDLPGTAPKFTIVTRGAEKASEEEIAENSRAASVRVRAIERLEGMPEFLPPGGRP